MRCGYLVLRFGHRPVRSVYPNFSMRQCRCKDRMYSDDQYSLQHCVHRGYNILPFG